MRFGVKKDYYLRKKAIKVEKRNKFFQSILRSHEDFFDILVYQKMFVCFSKAFLNRIKNRCKFTFSKHSIIRFYHINRHSFRNCASFGTFFGLTKASW